LEIAAFATVCAGMERADENRVLVKEGLKRLRESRNLGLRALMEVNGIDMERLSAYHLGFVLGPCLNATGRLDTAKRALELLQSATKAEAMCAARELVDMNDSRKNLTLQGVEEAEKDIREHHREEDKVLVVFLPKVHESLAGIIAGRVREHYNRPAFVLTRGEEGVKGSGRSIESYHMYDALTQVSGLLTKYGGHKMAAGLSMREEDVERLRYELNQKCVLGEEDFIPKIHIDVPLPLACADERLAGELELLEPFGVGNPKPLFAQKGLVFVAGVRMGSSGNCARFRVRTPEGTMEQLVMFRRLEEFEAFLEETYGPGSTERLYGGRGDFPVSVVYQLGLNTYRGRTEKQMILLSFC
ncbi:MAG: single-stranded-DNA-specific exonuclease RecJ, partial [Acetatifactor sp.]|nr:single-stranded-DNA-specific exonuclease RecJ [Acetatifactor sp.]